MPIAKPGKEIVKRVSPIIHQRAPTPTLTSLSLPPRRVRISTIRFRRRLVLLGRNDRPRDTVIVISAAGRIKVARVVVPGVALTLAQSTEVLDAGVDVVGKRVVFIAVVVVTVLLCALALARADGLGDAEQDAPSRAFGKVLGPSEDALGGVVVAEVHVTGGQGLANL